MEAKSNLPEPSIRYPRKELSPQGGMLMRGLRALFIEHRLPYQFATRKEVALQRLGFRLKSVRAEGHRFLVRRCTRDEDFIREVVIEKYYWPHGVRLRPNAVVVDVGGNIGAFTVVAAHAACKGRVIVVEPEPENLKLLRRNIAANGLQNVTPVAAALGDKSGTGKLYLSGTGPTDYQTGSHSMDEGLIVADADGAKPYIEVPICRLQDLFDIHRIDCCDFLKLDCEGGEYKILYTLPRKYLDRIQEISMEFHVHRIEDKRRAGDEMVAFLTQNGFEIRAYVDVHGFPLGHISAARNDYGIGHQY